MDVQAVEATNAQIRQLNDRALPVLEGKTALDLGVEPEKWKSWWTDQLGYAYQSSQPDTTKPTFTDMVVMPSSSSLRSACFGAGTSVHTVEGPRAIESIQVGDRCLSQNTSTGTARASSRLWPCTATNRRPRSASRRRRNDCRNGNPPVLEGQQRMDHGPRAEARRSRARARRPGRGPCGRTDKIQPVYNLDVAENRDFMVGTQGLLVHDFSFVQPVLAPFDRGTGARRVEGGCSELIAQLR